MEPVLTVAVKHDGADGGDASAALPAAGRETKLAEMRNQIAIVRSSEYGAAKQAFDDRAARQARRPDPTRLPSPPRFGLSGHATISGTAASGGSGGADGVLPRAPAGHGGRCAAAGKTAAGAGGQGRGAGGALG